MLAVALGTSAHSALTVSNKYTHRQPECARLSPCLGVEGIISADMKSELSWFQKSTDRVGEVLCLSCWWFRGTVHSTPVGSVIQERQRHPDYTWSIQGL